MIRLRRPAVAAIGAVTLAAAVAIPLWTLAQASAPHTTPPPGVVPTGVPGSSAGTPTQAGSGAVMLPGPVIKQDLALDCESAALQVALAIQHINVPQDQIYAGLPQDPRSPTIGPDGNPARWGDPFAAFVGDVNGYEPAFTGYGVYYPPIAATAEHFGAHADGHTGWTVAAIIDQLRAGNSVVVWLTSDFRAHTPRYWTAWDGHRIPWAIGEHAVPVIGYDPVLNTVTVVDVLVGVERTFSTRAFAAILTTFNGMGIAISRRT
jgi:uncharacterized protein YvpB